MFDTFYDFFTKLLTIGIFLIIPAIIVFKMVKRKKLPSNEYTPYDDLLHGRKRTESYTKEIIQEDIQHEIKFEDSSPNDEK